MSPHGGRVITADMVTADVQCRLDRYIAYGPGCWTWTGSKNQHGYGHIRFAGRYWYAHRIVYALTYGETPAGMVVRHTCDNPACVRPDHLLVGTQADNQRDMALRDRNGRAKVTNAQALTLIERYDRGVDSRVLAAEFGIARSTVYAIANGTTRSHFTGRGKAPAAGTSNEGHSHREEAAS